MISNLSLAKLGISKVRFHFFYSVKIRQNDNFNFVKIFYPDPVYNL